MLTGYVAFMECWCSMFAVVTAFVVFMGGGGGWHWTLLVLTEFVAFIELWGWTFVVVTALVAFYEVLGLDVCGGYSICSIGVGCLWCLKNL